MKFISKILIQFIELLFYGNFWIALGALAIVLQTNLLIEKTLYLGNYEVFVFSSTLFLYALHRIIGLQRVQKFSDKGRYLVIKKFKTHIFTYAVLGGIIASICFLKLPTYIKLLTVSPALLSMGYVAPIFGKNRRLRDFDFLKIFLVAFVWAWVTVILPFSIHKYWEIKLLAPMFIERFLFIFAITIPFDIRDLKIDNDGNVSTIPGLIGIQKSMLLSYAALVLMIIFSSYLFAVGFYPLSYYYGLLLSFLTTSILIYLTDKQSHDYFFTGVIDGTMILQFIFVFIFHQIF